MAGFEHHRGERVWTALREGAPLALARELANPYDPRAVRIDWNGQKLGYVPRAENAAVAQMLDRGERLEAVISRLQSSGGPWGRVRVAIWLSG